MKPVLIVGAGIGGLTTAIALSRAGIECRLFEKADELRPLGAGLAIQINALRVLAHLGIDAEVTHAGAPIEHTTIRTWRGRALQSMAIGPLRQRYGHGALGLHRGRLQQVLLAATAGVRLELGVDPVAIDQTGGSVSLTLRDGRQFEGALLVGADGLHSFVRRQLWGDEPLRYSGYTSWRGLCPNDGLVAAGDANESWGCGRRFGYVSIGHGQVYWFATETTPAGGVDPLDRRAALLARFDTWHAPIPKLVAATSSASILRTDIFDRPPREPWGQGLVTLLGDAAHPMTPNLGQGACQAIEDAGALAEELLASTSDPAAALRRFEARRAARTAAIVRSSWRFGALAQGDTALARFVRDRVVPLVTPLVMGRQVRRLFDP